MIARNHHFVSQCYLRGFTHAGTRQATFEVFDRQRGKQYTQRARNVAYECDFNTIDVPGQSPDALEKAIANFEGAFAPSLRRIIAAGNLDNEEDMIYLLNFISLLAVRNPYMRKKFVAMKDRVMRKIMGAMVSRKDIYESHMVGAAKAGYLKPDSAVTYEGVKDFVQRGEYDLEIPREDSIIREFEVHPAVLECLIGRKWSVVHAYGDTGFVTSDHPVCLRWQTAPPPSILSSPGFGRQGTDVIFPVAKNLAVIGRFEGEAAVIDASMHATARINSIIGSHASAQIYATDAKALFLQPDGRIIQGAAILQQQFFQARKATS